MGKEGWQVVKVIVLGILVAWLIPVVVELGDQLRGR